MVGREVTFKTEKKAASPKDNVLEVRDLECERLTGMYLLLKDLNLDVKAGEILGIAGVDGNGQSELIEAITGLMKATVVRSN